MTNENTISAIGDSGRPYSFDVYPWRTPFNSVGAVYMVLKKNGTNYDPIYIGQTNDLSEPIYIGQTNDLSERFDNHHKRTCFNRHGKTHIAVYGESSASRRFSIETDLVRNYSPVCND